MDSFCFDVADPGSLGNASGLDNTFGETENWFKFSKPAERRKSRRKSSHAATEAITALANENRRTPKKVKFEDEKKVEENKVRKATVPKEPSFMRPTRKRKIEKIENARGEKSAKKENETKSGPRSVTQPKPFSFTTRTRKTKSASEDEKKDVKKFKATCSQFTKPAAKRRRTTQVQPFSFMLREEEKAKKRKAEEISDENHFDSEITFRNPGRRKAKSMGVPSRFSKNKPNQETIERLAKPKTLPKPVVEPIPEVRPKKNLAAVLAKPKPLQRAAKAPTQAQSPQFAVKRRAKEREVLKERALQKEEEAAVQRQEAEEKEAQEAAEEIKELRASQVHKPAAVKRFKPIPERVRIPSTKAVTPKFSLSSRANARLEKK